jgi:PelA/Pel-15E family pectate lyase
MIATSMIWRCAAAWAAVLASATLHAVEPVSRLLGKPDAWFAGAEAATATASILSHQAASGGWPKNTNTAEKPYAGDRSKLKGTFDNGATTDELRFLARRYQASRDEACRAAFNRGLRHVLDAQYPTGGWPQSHPPGGQYHRHITFNDDSMVRILRFLREVASDELYAFAVPADRAATRAAFNRGVQCILTCQIRVDGRLAAWCAQHDEIDLRPRPARAYELVSLSGAETVGIVRLLMSLENPAPGVVASIEAAVAWLESVKITGMRVEKFDDPAAPGGRDLRVVRDPAAPPLWARFYEIGTNRPIFCDRDGVKKYALADIGHERRNGYRWLSDWPRTLLEKEYPAWKQKRAGAPARALPQAEQVFHQESRWLGADAALSVPIAPGRTLWLFGDTFIATSDARVRSQAKMVRNTVAVQDGADPRTARMSFRWGAGDDGEPDSFFGRRDGRWYWPGHGIRLKEGPLVLFLYAMEKAGDGGPLGFACTGFVLALIDHPDAPPSDWRPVIRDAPPLGFDAIPATAAVREGDHVVAVAIRQKGVHAGALVRYPAASLARGDVSGAQWWAGEARGWVEENELGTGGPAWVLDDAGAECSLHWSERTKRYVHVASYGFGATTIGVRTAPGLTGPWSAPVTVFRPPESDAARPFVYAAKGHPELDGSDAGDLLVTYAANSFTFADLLRSPGDKELYWPRMVCVPGMR